METALDSLEQTVQKTDTRLDLIAFKLEQYEKEFSEAGNEGVSTEVSVLKLLHGVNQMKEEYENLKREIEELQDLQKQLSRSLRLQMKQVHGRDEQTSLFDDLEPVNLARAIAAML